MFTAVILACFIDASCVEFVDRYGPYKTELECKARVAEMVQDIMSVEGTPPVSRILFKCDVKQGTKT